MIHFVGAGSGATDLITVRGAEILKNTDLVIYAGSLVNPELISTYCRKDVEIYNSAKMTLEEVTSVEIEADNKGLDVVRLHTGDPSLYSAIHEQIEILSAHDISFDVTPGVSAFSAAAAAVGAELTIPNVSQSLTITRVDGRTRVSEKESLASYAMHHATLALYLSAGQAERVRDELVYSKRCLSPLKKCEQVSYDALYEPESSQSMTSFRNGYSLDTPVVVVYKASWPDQKILRTTLGQMPERMAEEGIRNFALILVGDALAEGKIKGEENSKLYDKDFETAFRKSKHQTQISSDGKASEFPMNNTAEFSSNKSVASEIKSDSDTSDCNENHIGKKGFLLISCTSIGDSIMEKAAVYLAETYPDDEITRIQKHDDLEPRHLQNIVSDYFSKVKAIFFISASGIAVRSIAPFVHKKTEDPAVIVIDCLGKYVIPILSGHEGGANHFADEIAKCLHSQSIVTTASEVISRNKRKAVTLGIGCRRGVSAEEIEDAVRNALYENSLDVRTIDGAATIDLKKDEAGLREFAKEHHIMLSYFSADELRNVSGEFLKSDFVEKTVGVDNVSGRAAFLLAQKKYENLPEDERKYFDTPRLLMDKKAYGNVTVAIAQI